LLAIFAAPARAEDNVAFVEEQIAKINAADKVRHQIASAGNAVFVAERQAIDALGARGVAVERDAQLRKLYQDKVIPLLVRGLGEDSTRTSATDALQKIGPATLPPLLDAIAHDGNPEVRAGAAQALGAIRPRAREALPALIAALGDPSSRVRSRAAFALTDFALVFQEARAPLIQALADDDVRQAVTDFATSYGSELKRDAPEILRALQARHDADPVPRVAGWLYHGFLALAVLSLLTFSYGVLFRSRGAGSSERTVDQMLPAPSLSRRRGVTRLHKIYARTRGVRWSFAESIDISDLVEGLKVGDPKSVDFALRGVALLCFGLCTFLAIGFGMVFFGESAGWAFVGFVLLLVAVIVRQTVYSYRMRKMRKGMGN
jgi:hypothetical protein